jgi:tripartite-type tricarboxylate transporter receptor subunit TctC
MHKKLIFLTSVFAVFVLFTNAFSAATPSYEGKTIRIIVGYSPGGGYDMYARAIARHFGNHIPGKPTVIVENMTGAGSLIAANYLYKIAKPDGLSIGHFNGSLFFNQVLGQPGVEFDAQKFVFVGAAVKEGMVFLFTKKSGITSMEKLMASKVPVKMAGLAPGVNTDNNIRLIKSAFGLPIQVISGYKGSADIRLAMEQGEVAGSSPTWISIRSAWSKALQSGDAFVVLQTVPEPFSDLPNVPLAISYAKTAEARQLIEIGIHSASIFSRAFVLPPGTPREQVQILTKAFTDTLKDKEFLAEAEKANLDVEPVTAADLEKSVAAIFKLDQTMLAKLKDILFK